LVVGANCATLSGMPSIVVDVVIVMAALWFGYRITTFILKQVRQRRAAKPPPDLRCPRCGSKRLDDYSDEESGHCLECKHVWGVSKK
jgi:hypothetical protein